MQKHLSYDYAAALFAVAAEHKTETQVCIELHTAASAVIDNKQLEDFIECTAFPVNEKTAFVAKVFHGSHLLKNFLDLIVRRKAFKYLPKIASQYKIILDESKGLEPADVISAFDLDDHKRKAIEEKLKTLLGKKLEMKYSIDEKLLAGLVIKYKNRVLDGSLLNQFQIIREKLTEEIK